MSIALAFFCSDGLVLCADQEFSSSTFISYAPKITKITLAHDRFMVLAQAGLDLTISGVAEQVKRNIENKSLDVDEIRKQFQGAVVSVIGQKPKEPHQTLVALPGRILWRSQETQVAQVRGSHSIIGFGEQALAQYLLSVFLDTGTSSSSICSFQASLIGLYIVLQAKNFVPGCGANGPTDMMFLSTEGKVSEPYPEALAEIEERSVA